MSIGFVRAEDSIREALVGLPTPLPGDPGHTLDEEAIFLGVPTETQVKGLPSYVVVLYEATGFRALAGSGENYPYRVLYDVFVHHRSRREQGNVPAGVMELAFEVIQALLKAGHAVESEEGEVEAADGSAHVMSLVVEVYL